MRWMAALMALGLAACAADPPLPLPPPSPPEQASLQSRRRPVLRARNSVPAAPAPRPREDAPVEAAAHPPEEAPAARVSAEAATETRQERDRRAFVVCRERGSGGGPGVETVAACLQAYSSTGVIPAD